MSIFDKYTTWNLSCQNGCDNFKPQFERKATMLVQEVATGETRAFCWACIAKMSLPPSGDNLLELRKEFVFWPVMEDEEFENNE